MIEIEAKLKRWGRSFGIVVPMEKIKSEGISDRDVLDISIVKKRNALKDTFGTFKFKKSTQEMLDESDRESWDE
ncbi:hypothetical protein J4205_04270 [Candidatus Pacearchaeota archaeon]|nr:hypothetical protein [Candidatus Pacearchaeota archaeon]